LSALGDHVASALMTSPHGVDHPPPRAAKRIESLSPTANSSFPESSAIPEDTSRRRRARQQHDRQQVDRAHGTTDPKTFLPRRTSAIMPPMPITVTCSCGKSLKVRDELIGKRVKCPACGNAFPVQATTTKAAGGTTVFNPTAAAAAKGKREAAVGRVSISWGPIILGVLVLLVGVGITAFIMGPKKVWNQWEALGDTPQYDVIDVVTWGLQCHLSEQGLYNPRKGNTTSPQATEVMFYRPTMVMSMPEEVHFKGVSNMGPFEGDYNPHKRSVVRCELSIGGGVGIPGSGGKKSKGDSIKITGREIDPKTGKPARIVEVDGKDAVLHYPPVTDE
jgi:hypothetical protein